MSKKYGISCENCNALLNNEDNIFGTNLGKLYHSTCMDINHGKSADCQSQMSFKMNLKFADTPAEGECGTMELKNSNNATVQKLKAKIRTLEDALLAKDRLKDDVNKLMDCVVKLANTLSIDIVNKASDIVNNTSQDKSNKPAYDENNSIGDDSSLTEGENIEQNNSNNGMLQSVQQLEAKIKTLKEALLQTKSDENQLTECVEMVEKNIAIDNAPDSSGNNESDLSGEQHNETENAASTNEKNQTCTVSKEKQQVLDLRRNCVYVQNFECSDASLDIAFGNIRKMAIEMKARIAYNSIIHIDVDAEEGNYLNYYVYFRDEGSKYRFLKNRFIYEYEPWEESLLRILDYSNCGIVDIVDKYSNKHFCGWNMDTAFVGVIKLANKIGMTNISHSIDHIDVLANGIYYSVRFNCENTKNEFLQKKYLLKEFSETKDLNISDGGGHTSTCYDVHNSSMTAASTIVIGVAELMGLSLTTDNIKSIYVLNPKNFSDHTSDVLVSLVVEFSSNDIKNKFLQKKSELNEIENNWTSGINISDIATEGGNTVSELNEIENSWTSDINISDIETEGGNTVSIKYKKGSNCMFTAVSFVGLAKQMGLSFTPDHTDRIFELLELIRKTAS